VNLIKAWEQREKLNSKMTDLLLQGLQDQLVDYLRAVENYPPDRMAKYGTPFIEMLEHKIATIQDMIDKRAT